jgi:hypothetical protein
MPRIHHRRAFGPLGLLGVVATSLGLMGCPGSLDPALLSNATGAGGTSGGGTGSGGTSSVNCTGNLAGATLVTTNCAVGGCHTTADAPLLGANLDLTVNATIGSRLVGVVSTATVNNSAAPDCVGFSEALLNAGTSPATGLLVQKIQTNPSCSESNTPPCCGSSMPFGTPALSSTQQQCIIQWATTLTAAAQ